MNEKPILFKAEMVRAILEGRKTQTRRVADVVWDTTKYWGNYDCWTFRKRGKPFIGFGTSNNGQGVIANHCPYGKPGDRLWVRETWRPWCDPAEYTCVQYRADAGVMKPDTWDENQGNWCECVGDENAERDAKGMTPRWRDRKSVV